MLTPPLATFLAYVDNRYINDAQRASDYTLAAIKYDLAKYPHFQKWLMASIERPAAKEARKLRE